MPEKELIAITIDTYMNLQRIKKANGDYENKELDYQLRGVVAKLSSMGINVEDLTLNQKYYNYYLRKSVKPEKETRLYTFLHFTISGEKAFFYIICQAKFSVFLYSFGYAMSIIVTYVCLKDNFIGNSAYKIEKKEHFSI